MKINKMISIDVDIAERLQQIDNSSKLINDYLIDFFKNYSTKGTELKHKQAILKDIKRKSRVLNKEVKVYKVLSACNFDNLCIKWSFKHEQGELSEVRWKDLIYDYIHGRELKMNTTDFLKCYVIIRKNAELFKKEE